MTKYAAVLYGESHELLSNIVAVRIYVTKFQAMTPYHQFSSLQMK